MTPDVETVVIGAGAVGLAIARALCLAGHQVLVIEQHASAGTETTARNSQVVHAGLYYPPGSLKAHLCLEGNALLSAYTIDHGIQFDRCGKLIVAATADEILELMRLKQNAETCGVGNLRLLTAQDACALEPELSCVAAVLSPSTGVIDAAAYVQALESEISDAGGTVLFNNYVYGISQNAARDFSIEMVSEDDITTEITARNIVVAAGLSATQTGNIIPAKAGYLVPQTAFAKGHYFTVSGPPPFRHLIYPLPSAHGLGIHATHISGQVQFGPDVEWVNTLSYEFDDASGARRAAFEKSIKSYWPALKVNSLRPSYTGIRPKLSGPNEPASDFAIHGPNEHGIEGMIALYGIESPGLTASLAIGDLVAKHLP